MLKKLLLMSFVGVAPLMVMSMTGCEQQTTVKEEKKISTPEGTTTKTQETTIEKTGENPPETPK